MLFKNNSRCVRGAVCSIEDSSKVSKRPGHISGKVEGACDSGKHCKTGESFFLGLNVVSYRYKEAVKESGPCFRASECFLKCLFVNGVRILPFYTASEPCLVCYRRGLKEHGFNRHLYRGCAAVVVYTIVNTHS